MKEQTLHWLSREALSAQSLALRSPLMTSLAPDCLPPLEYLFQSIFFFSREMFLKWGVEYVEVGGGSLSDNQMIGFSLPIIFDSVSLSSPVAFGVPKRRQSKEIKELIFFLLSFAVMSMKIFSDKSFSSCLSFISPFHRPEYRCSLLPLIHGQRSLVAKRLALLYVQGLSSRLPIIPKKKM